MIRANPLYGRGCSFAAVAAFELKAALEEAATPLARARAYHGRIRSVLRPYFDGMRNQDRAAIKRAAAIRDFNTADSKVQVETQTDGIPNNALTRGLTLTWGDGTIWWLESFTLNQRTGEAWTWDCVWQQQES